MKMLSYIKQRFEAGDTIYLYHVAEQFNGVIEYIGEDYIVLRDDTGAPFGLKAEYITAFAAQPLNPQSRVIATAPTAPSRGEPNHYKRNAQPTQKAQPQKREYNNSTTNHLSPQEAAEQKRQYENNKIAAIEQAQAYLSDASDLDVRIESMGLIVELRKGFQFAFIDDRADGDRYYFNMSDIVDPRLSETEGELIDAIYCRTRNKRGAAAKGVHMPATIEEMVTHIIHWLSHNNPFKAKAILDIIEKFQPEHPAVEAIKPSLIPLLRKDGKPEYTTRDKAERTLYHDARDLMQKKLYEQALQVYAQCLEQDIRKINSIKDVIQIFITWYVNATSEEQKNELHDRALNFIDQYRDELPDEMSTLFTLENAYFALEEYAEHIVIAEDIVAESGKNGEIERYVFYLNKLAQSYLRINEIEKAKDAALQGLEVEPENQHLLKTKQAIDEQLNYQM